MAKNLFLIFISYFILGGLIYFIFLYERSSIQSLKHITFYSYIVPNISYKDSEDKPRGLAIDMLNYAFKKQNLYSPKIEFSNLSTALQHVLEGPQSSIIALIRRTEKEYLFKWVGPIIESPRSVYVLKKNFSKFENNIGTLKAVIQKGTFDDGLLISNYVPKLNISAVDTTKEAYEQVLSGKKDAFVTSTNTFNNLCPKDTCEMQPLYNLGMGYYYFAFNLNTPNSIIKEFQINIDNFKKTKEYLDYVKAIEN